MGKESVYLCRKEKGPSKSTASGETQHCRELSKMCTGVERTGMERLEFCQTSLTLGYLERALLHETIFDRNTARCHVSDLSSRQSFYCNNFNPTMGKSRERREFADYTLGE